MLSPSVHSPYGAGTMKPTMLITNSVSLCKMHTPTCVGKARKKSKARAQRRKGKSLRKFLCRQYVDRAGRKRFCGTRRLKQSQLLDLAWDGLGKHTTQPVS